MCALEKIFVFIFNMLANYRGQSKKVNIIFHLPIDKTIKSDILLSVKREPLQIELATQQPSGQYFFAESQGQKPYRNLPQNYRSTFCHDIDYLGVITHACFL